MAWSKYIAVLVLGAYSLSAQSALIDRGGGFIYDDVLDITWSQNADVRDHGGPFGDGRYNWGDQVAWADSLRLYDSVRDVTWDDWRLASMDVNGDGTVVQCQTASEAACQDNEFGYMFYHNGVTTYQPGVFTNVQVNYWSGTEYAPDTRKAWLFVFSNIGVQPNNFKDTYAYHAWVVRDGDVAAPIPIPAAAWLFLSALCLLGWMKVRR